MSVPVEKINTDRLALWAQHLNESHATPLLLIGIGHDHTSGQLVLCTLNEDEITPAVLTAFLVEAIRELQRR